MDIICEDGGNLNLYMVVREVQGSVAIVGKDGIVVESYSILLSYIFQKN